MDLLEGLLDELLRICQAPCHIAGKDEIKRVAPRPVLLYVV